ncbi:MAG: hypothetical protein AAF560_25075 [Acidobacteriota bacterium]
MPAENFGKNCLEEVAKVATSATGLNIELGSGKDFAVAWAGTGVHPLQNLETAHQRAVRQAGRDANDPQQAEFDRLGHFYQFQLTEPTLLGQGPWPDDPSVAARFSALERELVALHAEVRLEPLGNDLDYLDRTKRRLHALLVELNDLRLSFYDFPEHPGIRDVQVPILQAIEDPIQEALLAVTGAANCAAIAAEFDRRIREVLFELGRAVEGLAKISMIYSIEPFYLFRLLVPFRVRAGIEITQDERRRASGTLTDLINNRRQLRWLSDWLESKIIELDDALRDLDPRGEDLFFHLKGGRAQACLLREPQTGTNDWDTGIVINPELPAEYWYSTFNRVHNLVLQKFRGFKQEFFMLLHAHADEVTAEVLRERDPGDPDDNAEEWIDDDLIRVLSRSLLLDTDETTQGSCKAELIDIGIPRRDSVEAVEHWHHTRPYITREVNDLPIPGHLYYCDEYLLMIREALAGLSPSPHKMAKRVRRLYRVMDIDNVEDRGAFDGVVAGVRAELAEGRVPRSLAVCDGIDERSISRLIPLLLRQFVQAYDLTGDRGFAAVFDRQFERDAQQEIGRIEYLDEVDAGLEEAIRNFNFATHGMLLQWVALAARMSDIFERHFRDRATCFGFGRAAQPTPAELVRRRRLEAFVHAVCDNFAVRQAEDDWEVRIAVTGSFAAYLHAGYGDLEPRLRAEMDPVRFIDVTVYCHDSNVDPDTVRDVLLSPLVDAFVGDVANGPYIVQQAGEGAIHVTWPAEETIGAFTYADALVLRFHVERRRWPQVSFIRGFPVLALRDLIREYDVAAARAGEYGRVGSLKKTASHLRDLLTRYDP